MNNIYRNLYRELKKTDKYLHRESFYAVLTQALIEKLEESKVNINQEYGIVPVQDINLDEFSGKLKKGRKSKTRYHDPSILAGAALGQTINIYAGIN